MRRSSLRLIGRLFLNFTALLLCIVAFAQDQTSISGKVSDSKGVPIPAAAVSISGPAGKIAEMLTELDGSFRIEGLPAGVYQLTFEIVGFQNTVKDAVDSAAELSRNLAIRLEPLPRPASPSIPKTAAKRIETPETEAQAQETAVFQTAEVTTLPGLNQFQEELTNSNGDSAAASRQQNLLFISGNSANLDSGSFNDPGFRNE